VTGRDTCSDVAAAAIAFVREDVRSERSTPTAHHAIYIEPFRSVPPPTHSGFGYEPRQQLPLEARPLAIALRI